MSLVAVAIRSAPDWSRGFRLIVALSLGTIFTLLVFWLRMTNKAPWQVNFFLAPGGIFAIVLMFIVRTKRRLVRSNAAWSKHPLLWHTGLSSPPHDPWRRGLDKIASIIGG
jgi:hypothetical protein